MFNLEKSSKFYWSNYLKDLNIDRTPDILKPKNRIEAYGIQNNFFKHTTYNLFGWKIAATSSNGQKHIGVTEPLAGRIFKEKVYKNKSEIILGNNKMAVAEPEFAFKINKDIFPRKKTYSNNEVLSFIDDLYPAIELPNSRFTKYEIQGEEQLIADNACAHLFIIGNKFNGLWKGLDLKNHLVTISNQNRKNYTGTGSNVLGNPIIGLTWLVNELSKYNITINKELIISTGTCSKPFPINKNDFITADFGVLGRVEVFIK